MSTTGTLVERIGNEPIRSQVVADCVALIDRQVKSKGFMIKGAYATIKTIKKTFVPETIDGLLNDWLNKLQPHYERWAANKATSFSAYVISRADDVAEDLLSVTDARAERTSHGTAKKAYRSMRASAKANVVEAVPELARLVEKHLG